MFRAVVEEKLAMKGHQALNGIAMNKHHNRRSKYIIEPLRNDGSGEYLEITEDFCRDD